MLLQMALFHSFIYGWVIFHCIYISHPLYLFTQNPLTDKWILIAFKSDIIIIYYFIWKKVNTEFTSEQIANKCRKVFYLIIYVSKFLLFEHVSFYIIKKSITNKCWRGCGEKGPSCTVGRNVNWYSHYGE